MANELENAAVGVVLEPVLQENDLEKNKTGNLVKVILIAVISALVVGGIIFLVVYALSYFKTPDLTFTAPKGAQKIKTTTPFPNLATSVSTVGAVLADTPFRDVVDGFEIKPPSGWYVDDSRKTGAAVMFLSPDTKIVNNKALATFVSVSVGNTGPMELGTQVEITKKNILSDYPNYQIEDDKEVYLQARKYYLIGGYYITADGIKMRNRNMITIYNDKGYAIWATGPDDTWTENELIILTSMNSFKFL